MLSTIHSSQISEATSFYELVFILVFMSSLRSVLFPFFAEKPRSAHPSNLKQTLMDKKEKPRRGFSGKKDRNSSEYGIKYQRGG